MANNIDWGAAGKGALAGAATGASLGSAIPGVGTAIGALGGAAIGGLSEIGSSLYENKQQQDAEERQEQRDIRAEQRANAEYDRRLADAREYEHSSAQAERLAAAGINPLSVLTNGGLSQVTTSQPSSHNTGVAKGLKSRGSISDIISAQSIYNQTRLNNAEVENLDAQTKLIENQASTEHEKGYQIWVQNCVQSVLDGNAKDQDGVTEVFQDPYAWEYRYGFTIAEDGSISIVNDYGNTLTGGTGKDGDTLQQSYSHHQYPDGRTSGVLYNVSKFTFTNDQYGTYNIYESSLNMRKHREEVSRLIGLNHTTAEDLSQSLADMYVNIAHLVNDGEKAHADTVLALASDLEARFKYGDLFNKKWWIDEIHKAIKDGATVSEAISATVKNFAEAKKAKGKSVSLTETLDDSGKVIGTIWKMAGTLAD